MKLIDKDALVSEIERRMQCYDSKGCEPNDGKWVELISIKHFLNTLEAKEVDLELITGWFDHIAQIADDRMTITEQRMTDGHALDEIKCLAKNSSEFVKMHYKAQKGK